MSTDKQKKCCCGHPKKQHILYRTGIANGKGCRYLCTAANCSRWHLCDLKNPEADKTKGGTR